MPECPVGSNTACYKFIDDEKTKMTVTINGNDITLVNKGGKWAPEGTSSSTVLGKARSMLAFGSHTANRKGEAAAAAAAEGANIAAPGANPEAEAEKAVTAAENAGEAENKNELIAKAQSAIDKLPEESEPRTTLQDRLDALNPEAGGGGARRKRRSNKRKPKKSAKKPKRSKKGKTRKQKK